VHQEPFRGSEVVCQLVGHLSHLALGGGPSLSHSSDNWAQEAKAQLLGGQQWLGLELRT
jgi:hypothetical protein